MALTLDPAVPLGHGLRRLARRQLAEAIERVDALASGASSVDADVQVHEARKRCKEVRAIARLVRSSEGRDAVAVDRSIRRAARGLSASRDAVVMVRTLERIAAEASAADAPDVTAVTAVTARFAAATDDRPESEALSAAIDELRRARRRITRWRLDDADDVVRRGLAATMRGARRRWSDASELDPEPMHAWRTLNKRWWYQARLLEAAAPDELAPMITRLDAVGESLGDVHDLDVLFDRVQEMRGADGDAELDRVLELVSARRDDLARAAMRLAGPLFVERPGHAARRLVGYWRLAVESAPLPDPLRSTGVVAGAPDDAPDGAAPERPVEGDVERERTFLVEARPEPDASGVHLRQGYLAVDGATSVRIRSVDGRSATLTVKVGAGTTRHEFERSVPTETFDALWPLTEGRRVDKERFVRSVDGHTVEIDVFHDRLEGLVVAEVEFGDDESMAAFDPPTWFGREVSDDVRYTNARLAIDGLPDR